MTQLRRERRMGRSASCIMLALVTSVLLSCDRDGRVTPDGVVLTDSMGISIVENQATAWTSSGGWAISQNPLVTVGGDDRGENYQFFGVVFAGRLSDGRLVIADGGSRTLRWFDTDRGHLSSAGTRGEGPGEFRSLTWAGLTDGDSVLVWDGQAGRVSVFFDGEFIRDFRLQIPDPWGPPSVRGALDGGAITVVPTSRPGEETRAGVYRPEVPVWIMSPEGEIERELGRVPSTAVEYRPAATPGAVLRGVVPFGPSTLVAAGADRVIVGDNARYELQVYGRGGELARVIRIAGAPDAVTREDLQWELERRLDSAPPVDEIREGIRAIFEATPVPETKPYFDRVILDAAGYAWVRRGASQWDVIAPEGRWMGTVETPAGLEVTQIGSDVVVGVWADEYGVESARVFGLIRSVR